MSENEVMTSEEGKNWRALHEHMQSELESALTSLGWQYGPGEGLIAGIEWMKSEIQRLAALANEQPKQDRWWDEISLDEIAESADDGVMSTEIKPGVISLR